MTDRRTALAALDEATRRYRRTDTAHKAARDQAVQAVRDALLAGVEPTTVADRSPFTAAYVRRLARDAEIPPAKPGMKQRIAE